MWLSNRNSDCTHLSSFGSSGTIHVFSWDSKKGPRSENNCLDEFEQVCDEGASRAAEEPRKSLFGRIRIGKGQTKHRSFAQLRWKHVARQTSPANQQALTLFMQGSDADLVLCSMSGHLWRYGVDKDGVFSLKRTEDVFDERVWERNSSSSNSSKTGQGLQRLRLRGDWKMMGRNSWKDFLSANKISVFEV